MTTTTKSWFFLALVSISQHLWTGLQGKTNGVEGCLIFLWLHENIQNFITWVTYHLCTFSSLPSFCPRFCLLIYDVTPRFARHLKCRYLPFLVPKSCQCAFQGHNIKRYRVQKGISIYMLWQGPGTATIVVLGSAFDHSPSGTQHCSTWSSTKVNSWIPAVFLWAGPPGDTVQKLQNGLQPAMLQTKDSYGKMSYAQTLAVSLTAQEVETEHVAEGICMRGKWLCLQKRIASHAEEGAKLVSVMRPGAACYPESWS